MKNKLGSFALAIVLLVIGVAAAGCMNKGIENKGIDGIWIDEDGDQFTFTISGNKLTISWADDGEEFETYTKKEEKPSINKGATGTNALVGTWEGAMGITWSFTGNRFTQSMGGVKQTVPYKIKGNSIVTEYQGAEVEMEFEIDGDTLTIEVMGFEMEFERVKTGSDIGRNSGSGSIPAELIGEWYHEYPNIVVLEFTSENKAHLIGSGWYDVSVSGNKVSLKGLGSFKYSIRGNEMTMSNGTLGFAILTSSFSPLIKK